MLNERLGTSELPTVFRRRPTKDSEHILVWVYRFSLALFDVVPGPLDLSST